MSNILLLTLGASCVLAISIAVYALLCFFTGEISWPQALGLGLASFAFTLIFISAVNRAQNLPASQSYILSVAKALQNLPEERLLAESLLKPEGPTYNDITAIIKEKYRRMAREEAEFKATWIESLREAAKARLADEGETQ
ncbi:MULTISPECIES: hypothetical protein [Achromobacter]|uniref:hypothetical protein n=1 Tax=Achromobacter TaxID=222 RepID=UPI0023F6DFBA|nr:hypothetical protein [Achromobacter anxifer]MDF8362051.1 hypothetical protein [Achromobacter anxifer]